MTTCDSLMEDLGIDGQDPICDFQVGRPGVSYDRKEERREIRPHARGVRCPTEVSLVDDASEPKASKPAHCSSRLIHFCFCFITAFEQGQ